MPNVEVRMTTFLNVDLRIRTKSGMRELLEALGSSVAVLNNNPEDEFASIEIAYTQPRSIDEAIALYSDLIKALPQSARTIWDSCEACFDIGIQGGDHPHQARYTLSAKTISILQAMHAEAAITVYAIKGISVT